jgi:hypothetical protein
MMIKIILISFIVFVIWRTGVRYQKNDITGREFLVWLVFWGAAAVATLVPKKTDIIAQWLGVSRGADLLVYLSIAVLFFLVFKIIVKLERIEREITKLVRDKALSQIEKE